MTDTPYESVQTILYCSSNPDISKYGGEFFSNCKLSKIESLKLKTVKEDSMILWEYSENAINLFEKSNLNEMVRGV